MPKSLSLKDWIDKTGVNEVARLLAVEPSAVRHWRRGHCLPGHELKQLIRKYSNGAVTYDEMIDTFLKKQNQRRGHRRAV